MDVQLFLVAATVVVQWNDVLASPNVLSNFSCETGVDLRVCEGQSGKNFQRYEPQSYDVGQLLAGVPSN